MHACDLYIRAQDQLTRGAMGFHKVYYRISHKYLGYVKYTSSTYIISSIYNNNTCCKTNVSATLLQDQNVQIAVHSNFNFYADNFCVKFKLFIDFIITSPHYYSINIQYAGGYFRDSNNRNCNKLKTFKYRSHMSKTVTLIIFK